MPAQAAYLCDGPKCNVMAPKVKGERGAPREWIRVTAVVPGSDEKIDGAFHHADCAHAWLDDEIGVAHAPTTAQANAARDEKL